MADIVNIATEKTSLVKLSGCLEQSGTNGVCVVNTSHQNGRDYPHTTYSNTTTTAMMMHDTDNNTVGIGDGHGKEEVSGCGVCKHLSTGERHFTLIFVAITSCLSAMALSVNAPFYPRVAADKGMTSTVIGLVFGIFELVMFLSAPVFGYFLVKLGPKFVFLAGIFVSGCCNMLFGSLVFCPDGTPFIVLSLLIRSIVALGTSACRTTSYPIVFNEYKTNIGIGFGVVQTLSNFGVMLGPSIGGAFYELGGFPLPFYVMGIAELLNGVVLYNILPTIEQPPTKIKGSYLSLLQSPMVVIPMLSVFFAMAGETTYEATFSMHLKPLHLSVGMVGVIFGVVAFMHSVSSAVWGYVSDSKNIQAPIIIGGHLLYAVGYLVIGPSPLVPFLPFSLATAFTGLACIGASLGCIFIPAMKCTTIGASELGFDDNVETFGLLSGLFTSAETLGGFTGPVGVGYLVEKFDFPSAYTVVAMCHVFTMALSLTFFTLREIRKRALKTERVDLDGPIEFNGLDD